MVKETKCPISILAGSIGEGGVGYHTRESFLSGPTQKSVGSYNMLFCGQKAATGAK